MVLSHKSVCNGWDNQSHPTHQDLWGLLDDKQRLARLRIIPCFKDKSKDLLQMPQTQSYPRLLSQVQAEAHAQVEGFFAAAPLEDPFPPPRLPI